MQYTGWLVGFNENTEITMCITALRLNPTFQTNIKFSCDESVKILSICHMTLQND